MEILVSDELKDKLNMDQFYEDVPSDISISINLNEDSIKGNVVNLKISSDKLSAGFVCNNEDAVYFITGNDMSSVALFVGSNEDAVETYHISSILSRSLKLLENGSYICSLMIRVK